MQEFTVVRKNPTVQTEVQTEVQAIANQLRIAKLNAKIDEDNIQEQANLKENQLRRKAVVDKYRDFIENLNKKKPDGKNPRGIYYRCELKQNIKIAAEKVFATEDDEYKYIGKPSRGMFHKIVTPTGKPNFKVDEMRILGEIMQEFGTFDY